MRVNDVTATPYPIWKTDVDSKLLLTMGSETALKKVLAMTLLPRSFLYFFFLGGLFPHPKPDGILFHGI